MQLAPSSIAMAPSDLQSVADVVQPSKLFNAADARFDLALDAVGVRGSGAAPTVRDSQNAVYHALAGVRLLRSTLVPSTPFYQRQLAATAIGHAGDAVRALTQYEQLVRPLADADLDAGRVPLGALASLDEARAALFAAASRLG
ncbi:MAG: hypothetical protein JWM86_1198 [Thermoleophilia bacterium]|nr:hypothetical protein [Thermoleophilia bacterium]